MSEQAPEEVTETVEETDDGPSISDPDHGLPGPAEPMPDGDGDNGDPEDDDEDDEHINDDDPEEVDDNEDDNVIEGETPNHANDPEVVPVENLQEGPVENG